MTYKSTIIVEAYNDDVKSWTLDDCQDIIEKMTYKLNKNTNIEASRTAIEVKA